MAVDDWRYCSVGFVFEGEEAMLSVIFDGRIQFIPDERGQERHVSDPRNPLGSLRRFLRCTRAFLGTDYIKIMLPASPLDGDDVRQSWRDLANAVGWDWRCTRSISVAAVLGAGFSDGLHLVCERIGDVVRADLVLNDEGFIEILHAAWGHDLGEVVVECLKEEGSAVTDVLCVGILVRARRRRASVLHGSTAVLGHRRVGPPRERYGLRSDTNPRVVFCGAA